ncbi:MAG: isocitrate/isopropylmalate dehydrogenase family protein [Candidatus Tectomicrobia bacterium]|uniref:Isocitrate/isopropylmalate dehydrogenase family protein n=1 Tax=Tectimicrobiota bacterium TaxID=2528274 RepID=A0A932MPI9_UNCTE|nr:isocitrate/isopropylmalate dehydrogenase family protein [Candidatus Tectomicrobia bacterium]
MPEKKLSIAAIPGDGVGHDVVPVAAEVVRAAAGACGVQVDVTPYDYGAVRYLETGKSLPEDVPGLVRELASKHDAIMFGSAGLDPRQPKDVNCRDLLVGLRWVLDGYVNLRPAPLLHPSFCPLEKKVPIDLVVVRENTEGVMTRLGGNFKKGTPDEVAIQEDINTYKGVERICRYAFEYARDHGYPKVTMADKHGSLIHAHGLWQRVFWATAEKHPGVEAEHKFIDTLCMELVQHPDKFGVIVTNNMYGDILSDLCAGLVGGVGIAGSGCINPGNTSMFEPVHGTAPDIALKGIANPFAATLAGRIMLDHLGQRKAANLIWEAVKLAVKEGQVTADLGGKLGTQAVGDYLCKTVQKLAERAA